MTYIFVVSLLSNLYWSHPQCNASFLDLEQTYGRRVELQFKSSNSTDFSSSLNKCIITLIIGTSAIFLLCVLLLQPLPIIVKLPFSAVNAYYQQGVLLNDSVVLDHYHPQLLPLYVCWLSPEHNLQCRCWQHKQLCTEDHVVLQQVFCLSHQTYTIIYLKTGRVSFQFLEKVVVMLVDLLLHMWAIKCAGSAIKFVF